MSIEALRYVKKLRKSPSGEDVTVREKAMLWYLADSHNEAERAAWPSIPTIAEENNLEERTVRDILKSCISKGIVWRDDRKRENGSTTSNYWRFTAIDGEQPTRALIEEEEKRQILGRKAAEKTNQTKARKKFDSGNPQQACGEGCGITQGADAESRIQESSTKPRE